MPVVGADEKSPLRSEPLNERNRLISSPVFAESSYTYLAASSMSIVSAVIIGLLSVAMQAQNTLDGGDYDRYLSPNTLTLNGGECKSSPSMYDCDFISVSDGIKDTKWAYASIRIPTRNGSFRNGCFYLRDDLHPDLYADAETCAKGRWPLVGHANADTIRGKIQYVNRHVLFVDLNIKYTRRHGQRVPYIAPGSTVISR